MTCVVLVSDWFSEKMGYSENCLPKALAQLGAEVHLVTSDVQPYFDSPSYAETYAPFIGPGVVAAEVKPHDGYTLHRLPHALPAGRLRLRGLRRKLAELRPQVVQTFDAFCLSTIETAYAQPGLRYQLFLETHLHASVFGVERRRRQWRQRLFWRAYRATLGRMVSRRAVMCFPISTDAAEIAEEFLGLPPHKLEICSLGVDTDLFCPPATPVAQQARAALRRQFGFDADDVVCIYTGRFSAAKGPLLLAQAIDHLAGLGLRFRGLFVGNGTAGEIAAIQACAGCVVHPFVPTRELPPYYWAADVGVWPRQESTSQLDAAACGLPLILSDQVSVRERLDGNGLAYVEGDVASLARQISALGEVEIRRRFGAAGSAKMRQHFSWRHIAAQRLSAYEAALGEANQRQAQVEHRP